MSLHDARERLRQRRRDSQRGSDGAGKRLRYEAAVERAQQNSLPPPPPAHYASALALLAQDDPTLHAHLSRLDPWQLAAVMEPATSLLVRAQVGSGKTTLLIAKVMWILRRLGADPESVLVLSFTHRAAEEIRDRIAAALPESAPELARLRVGTYHGLCLRLLREHLDPRETGRSRGFRLLDEQARLDLLGEIIAQEGLRISYKAKLDRRLDLLRQGQRLFGNMKSGDDIVRLAELYELRKRESDLMDFGDLLREGRRCALGLRDEQRPAFIIVDEFQDSDLEQLGLLEDWRGRDSSLFAVGDPAQVIYSWRGGSAALFDDFEQRFGGKTLALPRNYRSTSTILEAARSVLDPAIGGQELMAAREPGRLLRVRRHHDPVAEARHLAAVIQEDPRSRRIAILVRTREQMQPIAEQLEAAGLSVRLRERRSGHDPLRDWLLRWLRWLDSGAQAAAAASVLADSRFGFPSLKGRRLSPFADGPLEEALEVWLKGKPQDQGFLLSLRTQALECFRAPLQDPEELFSSLGLEHFLEPRSSRFQSRRRRVVAGLEMAAQHPGEGWVQRWRDALALGEDGASPHDESDLRRIDLMTMHSAKGLEFDQVFISGANRGMTPLAASFGDPEQEAEERRLFFVAMTRAKDELEIAWFGRPPRATASAEPSAFIDAIPGRLIEAESEEPAPQATSPYGPGVCVRHPRYGAGVVTAADGLRVSCTFPKWGEKSFSLTLCPLKIEE